MLDIRGVATIIFSLSLAVYVVRQCRKPSGWVGRFLLWDMNRRHSGLTDWGLAHVTIHKSFTILDIGCGGGRTLGKLAAMAPEGKVCGVDYSPSCVAASHRKNEAAIRTGRVEIHQGVGLSSPVSGWVVCIMKPLGGTVLTVEEHRAVLTTSGYSEVEVHEERRKGWICEIGQR